MIPSHAIICPLSPASLEEVPEEEIGWESLESAPIAAESPRESAAARGADVEDVVDEDGDAVQVPRGMPSPPEPTADEIARHNLTHFPYRAWCPHCLACRRPNTQHRRSNRSSGRNLPIFCADYCFIKDSRDEVMITVLVGKLYPSGTIFATVCNAKGTEDEMPVRRLTQFI